MRRVRRRVHGVPGRTVEQAVVDVELKGQHPAPYVRPADQRVELKKRRRFDPPGGPVRGRHVRAARGDARVEESARPGRVRPRVRRRAARALLRGRACRRRLAWRALGIRSDSVRRPRAGGRAGPSAPRRHRRLHDLQRHVLPRHRGENPLYLPQAKVYAGACALWTGRSPPPPLPRRAVRDPEMPYPLTLRTEALRGRDVDGAHEANVPDLVHLPAAREPGPAWQRAAHRNWARPPRRLHARAGTASSRSTCRDRHPSANPVVSAASIVERSLRSCRHGHRNPGEELRRRRIARERERREL